MKDVIKAARLVSDHSIDGLIWGHLYTHHTAKRNARIDHQVEVQQSQDLARFWKEGLSAVRCSLVHDATRNVIDYPDFAIFGKVGVER